MLKGPFKVSFDLQGGTGETPLFYVFEGEIPFPKIDAPALEHYTFAGWALTKESEDFIDKYFDVIDKDETVFAIWTQFDHKVSYSAGEGIGEKEDTWVSGETHQLTFPENKEFEKIHFKFIGWKTSATGGTIYKPGDKLIISEDITLTAQWERVEVEVVYNAGGGSGTMAKEYKTLKFVLPASKFTRASYNFTGWKTSITGGTIYKPGQTITVPNTQASITLTAQWELAGVNFTRVTPHYRLKSDFLESYLGKRILILHYHPASGNYYYFVPQPGGMYLAVRYTGSVDDNLFISATNPAFSAINTLKKIGSNIYFTHAGFVELKGYETKDWPQEGLAGYRQVLCYKSPSGFTPDGVTASSSYCYCKDNTDYILGNYNYTLLRMVENNWVQQRWHSTSSEKFDEAKARIYLEV